MSNITDSVTEMYREQLAADLGDSATYTHASGDPEQTVNIQFEPYEHDQLEEGDNRKVNIQTIVTLVIGTETGDVSDVAIEDTLTFDGFVWGVTSIKMRTGATGWARLAIQRMRSLSFGSPGVVTQSPGAAPGGRFDTRGS